MENDVAVDCCMTFVGRSIIIINTHVCTNLCSKQYHDRHKPAKIGIMLCVRLLASLQYAVDAFKRSMLHCGSLSAVDTVSAVVCMCGLDRLGASSPLRLLSEDLLCRVALQAGELMSLIAVEKQVVVMCSGSCGL